MRFETGSLLVYDTTGVCRVEAVGRPEGIPVSNQEREYYTLTPVFGSGKIYIPVDTKVFMRPVISREEAELLIRKIPQIQEENCEIKNQKILEDQYKEALRAHQCEKLVELIKTAYTRKRYCERNGKRAGKTDLQYLKIAKTLLHQELSVALELPMDQVEEYVTDIVKNQK